MSDIKPTEKQQRQGYEVLDSGFDGQDLHKPLDKFDLAAFDDMTAKATTTLRIREDELRARYLALCETLKHWISEGLHIELERAAQT